MALALLFATVVATAAAQPSGSSLAQAGSVGGTIGKQDKSVSGGDDEGRRLSEGRGFLYPVGLDPNGDNWLALRSEPYGRGVRIRKMGPDALLELLGREGDWLRVRLVGTGEVGWASGKYLACCR